MLVASEGWLLEVEVDLADGFVGEVVAEDRVLGARVQRLPVDRGGGCDFLSSGTWTFIVFIFSSPIGAPQSSLTSNDGLVEGPSITRAGAIMDIELGTPQPGQ